jgi:phosphate transport system substrate-binding protein
VSETGPFFAGTEEEIARQAYPLARTIYLCTGPAPSVATREFIEYVLSPSGQAAITADPHGFYPLPAAKALPADEAPPLVPPHQAGYVLADGSIAIVGYNDMTQMLQALNAEFGARHPGFRFTLTLHGTRTGPPALAQGTSAFAPMGAEFSPAELAAYLSATGGVPRLFRVAHCSLHPAALSGPLAIMVHRTNPLVSLSLDEVAEIFSGRNTHGLQPTGLEPTLALALFLRGQVLGGGDFGVGFKGFKQSAQVVQYVAEHPTAIGFAAAMRSVPGVKMLPLARLPGAAPVALTEENIRAGRYPLDRFLLIYAREPVEPWLRAYLGFVLSPEGQAIIARGSLGYLPLNAKELAVEREKLTAGQ